MGKTYDGVIIGGGFFGLSIAAYLKEHLGIEKVLVLEKESDVMQRASYNNQARVHNGYHYPRSVLTALRSRVNFPIFVDEFKDSIVNDFDKYYAVAKKLSKVSASQFYIFCQRIEADIQKAPPEVSRLFDERLVEDVFKVKEYAFDASVLKKLLLRKVDQLHIELKNKVEVAQINENSNGTISIITSSDNSYEAKQVFNCTYSSINKINKNSKLPVLNLKHELAEMALMDLPKALQNISVTVMCGPFFSFMPFRDKKLHTLSHVRYTPHSEWHDNFRKVRDNHSYIKKASLISHFPQMIADAKRYIPSLKNAKYKESLWEIKTVLSQSEHDDSRPILFKTHHGINNYHCIMGGKMDNIYDAYKELDLLYA
jgi:L-2-hydroxyglutarate oxidase LhgO